MRIERFVPQPRYQERILPRWFSERVRRLLSLYKVLGRFPALTFAVPDHRNTVRFLRSVRGWLSLRNRTALNRSGTAKHKKHTAVRGAMTTVWSRTHEKVIKYPQIGGL